MNEDNSTKINIEDFIKIFPPLSSKSNSNIISNKFSKYFSLEKSFTRTNFSSIIQELNEKENYILKKGNKNSPIRRLTNLNYNDNIINENLFQISLDQNKQRNKSNDKILNLREIENFNIKDEEYYLIHKGILLQNNKKKRTHDVKIALNIFFSQSDLISKLTDFFKKYGISKENQKNNDNSKNKRISIKFKSKEYLIENRIQTILQKLVDHTIIEQYKKNDFIIKMNDIGKNCYFLISGRLSILKPAFYKNIKISYEDYFKYMLNLIKNKEMDLAKQVIDLNRDYINAFSIQNMLQIIRVYCLMKVRNVVKELDENKIFNINGIEKILNEYNLSLEDINLNKNEFLYQVNEIIKANEELDSNLKVNKVISDYFLRITQPTKEDIYIIKTYNFLFKTKMKETQNFTNNRKDVVTLGKYEIFMFLGPGAFFGETALESEHNRRNASIRAEEDCFVVSLDNELYNAIFLEENKKLKIKDINFICDNFFFNNISRLIFHKYYYPMLKFINKEKNDFIYLQDTKISSIYLLKEGSIKYEIYSSVFEINETIKSLIKCLIKNFKIFKINNVIINQTRKKYLVNKKIFNIRNQNEIINSEVRKKYKYEISSCDNFETMGILEFFMNINCLLSCYVTSSDLKLFEINRHSLETILHNEKDILDSYYTLIYSKIISTIKRLFSIESNFINQLEERMNTNFYSENNSCDNSNYNNDTQFLDSNYDNYKYSENSIKKRYIYSPPPIKVSLIKKNIFELKNNYSNQNIVYNSQDNIMNKSNYNSQENKLNNIANINTNKVILRNNINKNILNKYNTLTTLNTPKYIKREMKKSMSYDQYDIKKDTLINIGKSSLYLRKLKNKILLNKIIDDNKFEIMGNLVLMKNKSGKKSSGFNGEQFKNIFLKKLKKKIIRTNQKKEKYNIEKYLLDNNGKNDDFFPIIPNVNKKLTLNKNNKFTFFDINDSVKDFEEEEDKKESVLSKFVNGYYKNTKNTGYIGLVNVESNRFLKKKINI